QQPGQETSVADTTATITCGFSTRCESHISVHWYRQYPGQQPTFLLQRGDQGDGEDTLPSGHISVSREPNKRVSRLTIFRQRLTDSAVYYCALRLDSQ
uniref:Ig-like domain-containing protein n=1 Tax=Callorhinchus milii TaxID=7868 RepID=A0A4W3ILT1_CALMI